MINDLSLSKQNISGLNLKISRFEIPIAEVKKLWYR
jgi:hypothetical protein